MAILGRRQAVHWAERVRSFIWPRIGVRRSASYVAKRLSRMRASPHALAAGFASGVACSFFPFIGFHILLSCALAWMVRGNFIAAAMGTLVGNPVTFPFMFTGAYTVGVAILSFLGVDADADRSVAALGKIVSDPGSAMPVIGAICVGAVPLGAMAFGLFYVVLKTVIERARQAMADRRAARESAR